MKAYLKHNNILMKYLEENKSDFDVLIEINSEDGLIGIEAKDLYKRYVFVSESQFAIRNARLNIAQHKIEGNIFRCTSSHSLMSTLTI